MATVKFFGNLRQMAGKPSIDLDGQTVFELLENVSLQHKSIVEAILEDGNLRPYYKIMVNGIDISLAQGLDTAVHSQDVVAIFPPIAGGNKERRRSDGIASL